MAFNVLSPNPFHTHKPRCCPHARATKSTRAIAHLLVRLDVVCELDLGCGSDVDRLDEGVLLGRGRRAVAHGEAPLHIDLRIRGKGGGWAR